MSGCAWVVGDNIDTDVLAPGHLMKLAPHELATHCLEAIDPDFAQNVAAGDFLVAGRNFGLGSSREQAAVSLKLLGLKAVFAPSFARIFYRNAINLGLPVFIFESNDAVSAGDCLDLNIRTGLLRNETRDQTHQLTPLPDNLFSIIEAGGLMEMLKRRLKESA
ncbi:MAG: 3-isopropylmalate dehydratase [Pseudomonadota bacterium]